MTGFGPLTASPPLYPVGAADAGYSTLLDTGLLADSISDLVVTATLSGTSATIISGSWGMVAFCYSASDVYMASTQIGPKSAWFDATGTLTWHLPSGAYRVVVHASASLPHGSGALFTYNGSYDTLSTNYCAYGTKPRPYTYPLMYLTAGIVGAIIAGSTWPVWVAAGIRGFTGTAVNLDLVCNGPPPTMPVFDPATDMFFGKYPNPASAWKFWQALVHASWPEWCECNPAPPGSAAPVIYPVTPPVLDPGMPTDPPGIVCDAEDICTTINNVVQFISNVAIQNTMNNSAEFNNAFTFNTELNNSILSGNEILSNNSAELEIVKKEVLRATDYSFGTLHDGLEETGEFDVAPGILGLLVQVNGELDVLSRRMGHPINYHTECHVNFGTATGWYHTENVRHLEQIFIAPPWTTRVAFHVIEDLALDITELVAIEP